MNSKDFLKEGFVEDASDVHMDHEVQMAREECYHAAEHALAIHKLLRNISEQQGLEGWVSSKITLANDYLNTVREHLEYELLQPQIDDVAIGMPIAENEQQGVAETSDYFRRRDREESIISGKKPARKKQSAQTSDYAKRREQEKKQGVAEGLGLYGPFTVTISTGERPQSRTKTKKFRREDDAILWAQDWLEDFPQYSFATAEVTDPEGNVVWTTDEQGVAEETDDDAYHTRLGKGKFLPSVYGDEDNLYLHDLMNSSGDGSGPMLVTIKDRRVATELAAMYGGNVEKTAWGTYRVFQPRGQTQTTKNPELVDVAEAGPFSYGARKPRKGSVAANAEQKRREQERGKQPIEPRDQRVGTAKVTKGVAEGAKCNHTMEGENCPVHGLKECPSMKARALAEWRKAERAKRQTDTVNETTAGSVAGVVNAPIKNKAKVGSLFGGSYKQPKKAKKV